MNRSRKTGPRHHCGPRWSGTRSRRYCKNENIIGKNIDCVWWTIKFNWAFQSICSQNNDKLQYYICESPSPTFVQWRVTWAYSLQLCPISHPTIRSWFVKVKSEHDSETTRQTLCLLFQQIRLGVTNEPTLPQDSSLFTVRIEVSGKSMSLDQTIQQRVEMV